MYLLPHSQTSNIVVNMIFLRDLFRDFRKKIYHWDTRKNSFSNKCFLWKALSLYSICYTARNLNAKSQKAVCCLIKCVVNLPVAHCKSLASFFSKASTSLILFFSKNQTGRIALTQVVLERMSFNSWRTPRSRESETRNMNLLAYPNSISKFDLLLNLGERKIIKKHAPPSRK